MTPVASIVRRGLPVVAALAIVTTACGDQGAASKSSPSVTPLYPSTRLPTTDRPGAPSTPPTATPPTGLPPTPTLTTAVLAAEVPPTDPSPATMPPNAAPVPNPSTPTSTTAGAESGAAQVNAVVQGLNRRQKLAQTLFVGFNTGGRNVKGSTTAADAQAVLDEGVGGVFVGRKEVGLFTDPLLGEASRAPLPLLVATDGEGGRVDIWSDLAEPLPPAREMAALPAEQVREMAAAHGRRLRELGVNVNFAPMLDLEGGPNPLGDRTWSSDPAVVSAKAGAFSEGMCSAGVYPTFKHFPGHGRSDYDADLQPARTPPLDELKGLDLLPWKDLFALMPNRSLVMTGHLDVPGLTSGLPLSLDPVAMRFLREDMGFDGVAVTDELAEMGSITQRGIDVVDAVGRGIIAGNDMALYFGDSSSTTAILDHLERLMDEGELTQQRVDEAATRVVRLKLTGGCPG